MGPALGRALARGPWGFRHQGTSRPQTPTSARALCRAGNGEERGRPYALATQPRSGSRAPSKPHGVRPASVRGPWSRRRLEHPKAKALRAQPSAGRPPVARGGSVITEPRGARRPPVRTHAVGPGTGKSGADPTRSQPRHAPALEPPASRTTSAAPQSEAHGETPPPLPFSKRYTACPGPCPGSRWPARAPSTAIAGGRGTREDGRGGEIPPNGRFQSRL